ncbi:hypothetical protein CRG98_023183, partial [Punica granatum]
MATLLHHFCSSSTFSNGCVKNPLQFQIRPVSFRFIFPPHPRRISLSPHRRLLVSFSMDSHGAGYPKEAPFGVDMAMEEEYAAQSKLLQDFVSICNIERAWTFKSENGKGSMGMFSVSQPNLLANKRKKFIISAHISKERTEAPTFQWSPFPVEMTGVSTIVPSPSGSKLLVVRNADNECPTQFEIWSHCQLENEFQIAQSVHGSVYTDGWFEGISWNSEENLIAYVAEVPAPPKPTFNSNGYKKGGSNEKDCSSWKGQGEFEEEWGETYAGKRQPGIFVINLERNNVAEDFPLCNLTPSISSACHPRFSPDGKYLLFLSCKSSVDSGAHSATNSLHRIHWLIDGKLNSSETLYDV